MPRIPSSLVRLSYRIHFPDILVGALAPFAAIYLRDLTYFTRSDLEGFLIYSAIATLATVASIVGSVHGGGVISVWIDGVFFCRFLSGLGWSPRQAV